MPEPAVADPATGLLPEPARDELRLEHVLSALSDPLRLSIVQAYLRDAGGEERACGWFKIDRPKSTRTHHWKVLRESGVVRQRQVGLERRNTVREADLDARFPGLLDLVRAWRPAD
ncbi:MULTISPECIES: ArsR/SmtB family transcription factor [Glycomyces]|uniref:DNA-binding transcriptional ArsR family regulator n=1 Tax=Glycomyces artemisiae TaxID=1076443 RepID=A0A2T0UAK1_9ACTN|nr:helix-turn-helix transcriptional regulator [Glycomyces artemisiae]PRY54939.1 DNA-binding transcriptional ArsR family regulator [Glycomyces artemisiae]